MNRGNTTEAADTRDAIAKLLYSSVFLHLVKKINETISKVVVIALQS